MAKITVDKDTIHVELSVWDKLLAVHGSLHIPLAHVKSVSSEPVHPGWFEPFKLMGAHWPGLITAGTFATKAGYAFYDVRDGERCVTLDLEHEFYKKIFIQLDATQDPVEITETVRKALTGSA